MGLYVSTTGTDVEIPELGISIIHPTSERELSAQFSAEEIRNAPSLTSAIRDGTLAWKKTFGGDTETATDYDPDFLEVDQMNTGLGKKADRVVTFKDLFASTVPAKSGTVSAGSFSGNPKTYTVVFETAYPDNNYAISVLATDRRAWSFDSRQAGSFVINSNANQALTSNVTWDTIYNGEV